MTSTAEHAGSTKAVRTTYANVSSFGISAGSTASTQSSTPLGKARSRRKMMNQRPGKASTQQIRPGSRGRAKTHREAIQKIHLNKDDDPKLQKHSTFIASSNMPRQDLIERVRKRARSLQPEDKDARRLKCMSDTDALPASPSAPRECSLRAH